MIKAKKYRSKVDFSQFFPVLMLLLGVVVQVTLQFGSLIIMLFGMQCVFQLFSYFNLWYSISASNRLIIRNGWLFNRDINIMDIENVLHSRVKFGSPTMAMDGLEITYEGSKKVYVTPKEEAEFVKMLKNINPDIDFEQMNAMPT